MSSFYSNSSENSSIDYKSPKLLNLFDPDIKTNNRFTRLRITQKKDFIENIFIIKYKKNAHYKRSIITQYLNILIFKLWFLKKWLSKNDTESISIDDIPCYHTSSNNPPNDETQCDLFSNYMLKNKKWIEPHWEKYMSMNYSFFYKGVYYLCIYRVKDDNNDYSEYFSTLHEEINGFQNSEDNSKTICLIVHNFKIIHEDTEYLSHIYYFGRLYTEYLSRREDSIKLIYEKHTEHPLNATIVICENSLNDGVNKYKKIYGRYHVEIILFVHTTIDYDDDEDNEDHYKNVKKENTYEILSKNYTLAIKKPRIMQTLLSVFNFGRSKKGGKTKKMHYNKRARLRQKRSYKISHAKLHAKTQRKIHKTK
jgi:hypothetical protein